MSSTPASREPIRILMLEDNVLDAELLARRLRDDGLGFVSRVVSTELAFRREITDFAPQVILSDFSLPQFDGLTALRIAHAVAPHIPFIFVSGTIGEERAVHALRSGAADYVLKDNLTRLAAAIEGAIERAEVAKARDVAEEMLRRSESRLQDIVNTSADWIWECDALGRFTFSSPSVAKILGYGPHEILGRPALEYLFPDDRGRLEAAFAALRANEAEGAPLILRWRHKGGTPRWLERTMVLLRSRDGEPAGFRGIDRDATTRVVQEERIARLNRALRFLSGANSAIVRLRDRRSLFKEACRLAVHAGGYGMATICLSPRATDEQPIVCRAVGRKHAAGRPPVEPLTGAGPAARAIATADLVIVPDLADPRTVVPAKEQLLAMRLRSCIALPIVIDGTAVGVVQLYSDEPNVFSDAEIALLRQVTGNITFSLKYLHSKESAQYLEFFDTLTALANRTLYLQRLDAMIGTARQADRGLALLVLDIAGLTVINDGLGHHAGDLLLQLVAERLKNTFGDSNCLCHLGSGRYVVAAIDGDEPESAAALLRERVNCAFDAPFVLNDEELRISIKAGVAHYPDDGADAEALLQRAHRALDRAKREGEQYLRHSPDMDAEAFERLSMTNRLRQAVAEERFEVHYQPKVDLRSRMVTGAEALLRWPSMTEGYVSPAVFVPMLESLGLIDAVGRWVIGRALSEGGAHFAESAGPFTVAVNVSPRQLRREEFVDEVLELLVRVPHGSLRLELEVTESMLMADSRRAGAMLKRLRDAGLSIAIDDFGTGHSSLQILSRLPIDVLKIDRSFVRDLPSNRSDRLIVQTTVTLARSLGMKTVAEGVETEAQLGVLAELGCDEVQGFLLHRPVPAPELGAWLAGCKHRALA